MLLLYSSVDRCEISVELNSEISVEKDEPIFSEVFEKEKKSEATMRGFSDINDVNNRISRGRERECHLHSTVSIVCQEAKKLQRKREREEVRHSKVSNV